MDKQTIIVALCVVGGCSLAGAVVLKYFFERATLKLLSIVCYRRVLSGQPISWDIVSPLYTAEMERVIGIGGNLTPPEAQELVVLVDHLCERHPPKGVRWNQLVRSLDDTIPDLFVPGDGLGRFVMGTMGLIMLMTVVTMLGVTLSSANSDTYTRVMQSAGAFMAYTSVPAAIFCLTCLVRLRWFLKVRRALHAARLETL